MAFWEPTHPPLSVLIGLDFFGNTLIWWPGEGWGLPGETISSRSGRLRYKSRCWRVLARILDFLQNYHDQLAIEHDLRRAQRIEALELAAQAHDDALIEREEQHG